MRLRRRCSGPLRTYALPALIIFGLSLLLIAIFVALKSNENASRINPYSNVAFGKIKSSPEEESKLIDLLSNQIIDPPHVASHLECSTEKRNKFDVRVK